MISGTVKVDVSGNVIKGSFDFDGLSSDTKPTETYNGDPIKNGSSFFEMDTKTIYFYDAASKTWK